MVHAADCSSAHVPPVQQSITVSSEQRREVKENGMKHIASSHPHNTAAARKGYLYSFSHLHFCLKRKVNGCMKNKDLLSS